VTRAPLDAQPLPVESMVSLCEANKKFETQQSFALHDVTSPVGTSMEAKTVFRHHFLILIILNVTYAAVVLVGTVR